MSFASLGLSTELLRAISEENYNQPTPIQRQAIPAILTGKDIMAAAQTGTGKTAGFTLPILQRLQGKPAENKTRALILTPTRELAAQVGDSVKAYGKYLPYKTAVVFGGVKINPQIARVRQGADIIVATPGRLLDLVAQRVINLSTIEMLVLDEADRMLDMGFIHDIRKILHLLPQRRQNLLFSATFSAEIKSLANQFLHAPKLIEVSRPNATAETIKQIVHPVDRAKKTELLGVIIGANNWRQVLVFTRTRHGASRLAKELDLAGLPSTAIHGDKTQGARIKALAEFKQGKVRVLVATDIAARGLDIDKLPHVINFELPNIPEDYVHRIGRTGRAQNEGAAISLVCVDELEYLRNIEKLIKFKIPQVIIPGYEPDPSIKPQPINKKKSPRPQPKKAAKPKAKTYYYAAGKKAQSSDKSKSTSRRHAAAKKATGGQARKTFARKNRD